MVTPTLNILKGKVIWFNSYKNKGVVVGEDGKRYLLRSEKKKDFLEGELVEFEPCELNHRTNIQEANFHR